MNNVALNPTQLHLLKMFSFAKTEDTLFEIKKALSAYFAQKVEDDMDQLWEQGLWDQEKNENILKEHLRTPYVKQKDCFGHELPDCHLVAKRQLFPCLARLTPREIYIMCIQ